MCINKLSFRLATVTINYRRTVIPRHSTEQKTEMTKQFTLFGRELRHFHLESARESRQYYDYKRAFNSQQRTIIPSTSGFFVYVLNINSYLDWNISKKVTVLGAPDSFNTMLKKKKNVGTYCYTTKYKLLERSLCFFFTIIHNFGKYRTVHGTQLIHNFGKYRTGHS